MPNNNFIALHIETAGDVPWRNPIVGVFASKFIDGAVFDRFSAEILPRPGSEIKISGEPVFDFSNGIHERTAFSKLSTFCNLSPCGQRLPIVVADLSASSPFLVGAVNRHQHDILPISDNWICLKNFASLLTSIGRMQPEGLTLTQIARYFNSDPGLLLGEKGERADAIGEIYWMMILMAGWR